MKKHLVITLVLAFFASATAWSQTDSKAKEQKSKTEQAAKAEEKSHGAAYSGQGKGGEKNMTDKQKPAKGKKGKKGHPHKGDKGKEKGKDLKRAGDDAQPQGRPKPATEPQPAPKNTEPVKPAPQAPPAKPSKESPTEAKPKPVQKSGGK